MIFDKESDFEEAVIGVLVERGWEPEVIRHPSEADLLKNWADILFNNNRQRNCLNECPLTDGEMQQIMEQIINLRTPLKLNSFINGRSVSIIRDNLDDELHFGKEVSLKIYDRQEIAYGESRYQIVQQPHFNTKSPILNDRRGDLMLLINGMPVIHIELKRSDIPVSDAYNQIIKYSHEGVFRGIFSLIQVFVAMEPEEAVYFANPGEDGVFNPAFFFHWADFDNVPINEWDKVTAGLLNIPMAHMLIGFYTIADTDDHLLKVMRSYQYYAAIGIADRVTKRNWKEDTPETQRGGHVWHTTGSGKTMTSFKSAQLIASSHDADKVIFLVDRKELGIQSLKEYRSFATETESVQATENTDILISKLKSDDHDNTLIVTSIQKLSNISEDMEGLKDADLKKIRSKRLVIIIDECHRSTFGDMLTTIKDTFKHAIIFGFTGTPIQDVNIKKDSTTTTIFGNEIHRYTLADGIRDKNVLGFDPYMVKIYDDDELRQKVALEKAKAETVEAVMKDEKKKKVFYKWMDPSQVKMYGKKVGDKWVKGIEDFIPNEQYQTDEYIMGVISDIKKKWLIYSRGGKFHAIFATSSIPEAVRYWRLMKKEMPELMITAMFDPTIDNESGTGSLDKEDGIVDMLEDYRDRLGQTFTIPTYDKFRKDVSLRLAHKKPYERLEPDQQIDILIVVNQMLTGFDSKWVNTLYLDKVMEYENLIQAFSRTNRVLNDTKPYGNILDFRSQSDEVDKAIALFSGENNSNRAKEIWLVDPAPKVVEKLDKAVSELEKFMESQGLECKPEEVNNLKGNAARCEFINKFKEVQRLKTQLEQYTEIEEKDAEKIEELLPEDTLRAFRGAYIDVAQRLKSEQGKENEDKNSEVEQLDFEFVLFSSAIIDYDYIMALIAKYTQTEPKKQKMSKEQLIGMLSATSNLLDEREDIIEYIDSLQVGVALDEKEIKTGYQKFREQKNNQEINIIAKKHGIEIQSLQAFIQEIIDRMIFDGEKLGDLFAPLDLSWRERTQKELDLVADLIPLLKRLADGREIVGLSAYE